MSWKAKMGLHFQEEILFIKQMFVQLLLNMLKVLVLMFGVIRDFYMKIC